MKVIRRAAWTVAAGMFAAIAGAQEPATSPDIRKDAESGRQAEASDAESRIRDWPAKTRKAARTLIEKYGPPDSVEARRLVWDDEGRWRRVVVHRDPKKHAFPMPHEDFLEHAIDYRVPADRVADLRKFDRSLTVDRTRGTLSSRCDSEKANTLALNLAHEIATGKRDVESAKRFMGDTMKKTMAGKSSHYTEKLLFQSEEPGTAPPQRGY